MTADRQQQQRQRQRQRQRQQQQQRHVHCTHILAGEESLVGVLELSSLTKAAAPAAAAAPPGATPLLMRHLGNSHPLLVLQAVEGIRRCTQAFVGWGAADPLCLPAKQPACRCPTHHLQPPTCIQRTTESAQAVRGAYTSGLPFSSKAFLKADSTCGRVRGGGEGRKGRGRGQGDRSDHQGRDAAGQKQGGQGANEVKESRARGRRWTPCTKPAQHPPTHLVHGLQVDFG